MSADVFTGKDRCNECGTVITVVMIELSVMDTRRERMKLVSEESTETTE
jgi:hypothetical protein